MTHANARPEWQCSMGRRHRCTIQRLTFTTLIDVRVRDEAVVERLASELKACGCEVRVHTEEQYDELKT